MPFSRETTIQNKNTPEKKKRKKGPAIPRRGWNFYILAAVKNLQNNEEALKRRHGSSRKRCEGPNLR